MPARIVRLDGLCLAIPQNSRCRRGLRLERRYFGVVFQGEIQQPFLGEGVGVLREPAAALRLFLQDS